MPAIKKAHFRQKTQLLLIGVNKIIDYHDLLYYTTTNKAKHAYASKEYERARVLSLTKGVLSMKPSTFFRFLLSITIISLFTACSSRVVVSYDEYKPPEDEFGDYKFLVYEVTKETVIENFADTSSYKQASNNTPEAKPTLQPHPEGGEFTFVQNPFQKDYVTFSRELDIPMAEYTRVHFKYRTHRYSFLTVHLIIDGKDVEVLRSAAGEDEKWVTVKRDVKGAKLQGIRLSFTDPKEGNADATVEGFGEITRMGGVISPVKLQRVKLLEGPASDAMNLIVDGGFEESKPKEAKGPGWYAFSWGDPMTGGVVNEDPYSGTNCMKGTCAKSEKGMARVFMTEPLPISQGKKYIFSGWAKGLKITRPVQVVFGQLERPYKWYTSRNVSVGKEWTYFELEFPASSDVRESDFVIFMHVQGTGTLWLDDLSFKPMKEKRLTKANLVYNGSFEVGLEGWGNQYRSGAEYVNFGDGTERIGAGIVGNDAMRLHVPNVTSGTRNNGIWSTSRIFPAKPGEEATFTFYAKLEELPPGVFSLHAKIRGIETYKNQDGGNYPLYDTWHKYEIPITIPESARELFYLFMDMDIYYWDYQPGVLPRTIRSNSRWTNAQALGITNDGYFSLDGVSVTYGRKVDKLTITPVDKDTDLTFVERDKVIVGYAQAPGTPEDQIYELGGVAPKTVINYSARDSASLYYQVIDFPDENVIGSGYVNFKKGTHSLTLDLPGKTAGAFKLQIFDSTKKNVVSEYMYHVLLQYAKKKRAKNSPFGIHIWHNEFSARMVQKIGAKWIRDLYGSLLWPSVEPKQGEWRFPKDPYKWEKQYEMDVMPALVWTPLWAVSAKPEERGGWTGGKQYAPVNLEDYATYVEKTIEHYNDEIDVWELWNEPNLGGAFWNPGMGRDSMETFFTMIKGAYTAAKKVAPDDTIVVQMRAGMYHPDWTIKILEKGLGDYADVVSYHYYKSTLPASDNPSLNDVVAAYYETHKKTGSDSPLDVWMSEGGCPNPIGWRKSDAYLGNTLVSDATRWTVMATVEMLRTHPDGKVFLYHMYNTGKFTGLVNLNTFELLLSWDGVARPTAVAYGTMTHFLEGKKHSGYKKTKENVECHLFKGKEESVVVAFKADVAAKEYATVSIPYKAKKIHDAMGREVSFTKQGGDTTFDIGRFPCFVVVE